MRPERPLLTANRRRTDRVAAVRLRRRVAGEAAGPVPDELRPRGLERLYADRRASRLIARAFNKVAYYRIDDTIYGTSWLGTPILKYPTDVWIYQELVAELRPNLIVETGTYLGGSARFLATVCDLLGHGQVLTVDSARYGELPEHPRITYLLGSSTDPAVVDQVHAAAAGAERVLVILDSLHERDHVEAELAAYADLVQPGGYLVVEDTCVNGHPVLPNFGPGPMEAVDRFLARRDDFRVDPARERFMLTQNPRGFLQRVR